MASVGSESPPRKKLKQARLPFQVISSARTEGEKATGGLKRKLSEEDDIQITKVVRSGDVEEIKENTVQDDLKTNMKAIMSTLLTSKIINKCTEDGSEDDILKEKNVNNEETPSKETVEPEVNLRDVEQTDQKSVLSKNALDKLASWKKALDCTPSKSENDAKDSILASADQASSDSECRSESGMANQVTNGSESSAETQCPEPANLSESAETSKEVENMCEEHGNKILIKTVIELDKPEDNQSLNKSANSSIIAIELDCSEDDKDGDPGQSVSLASPKTAQSNSIASPRTPKGLTSLSKPKLTPKQLARMKEAARKQEEKEKIKLEKERKRQEEQEEKQRLKQEKEGLKKKEKEEKEEQKRKEKEEKEKKRQADIEQKNEEKRRKEEQRAEEKRKKEDEKRKADEEEVRKMAKASAMFTSFFVAKGSKPVDKDTPASSQTVQNFMPFEVKADMRVAPCSRNPLDLNRLSVLDEALLGDKECSISRLYVEQLRNGITKPQRSGRTWLRGDTKDEEISILEPDSEGVFIEQPKMKKMRAKLLQFHENHRPAFYGTWRKKSKFVTGRRPTAQDKILDYDVDSADEWEEEEPGESLHGSDDEKEKESEDEYEVDNSVFVPHGYLSDDEGDAEIDENTLNPEMQKAKLKILGEEFETQMKTKTSVLKPIVIILTAAIQSAKLPGSARYQKLADRRAVWREEDGPINLAQRFENCDYFGTSPSAQRLDADGMPHSGSRGGKPQEIVKEAVPALITLVHGSQTKGSFLVSEFYEFLKRQSRIDDVSPLKSADSSSEAENSVQSWPKLPTASKASIARKLKELAVWETCLEEGPMKGKRCWVIPQEKRDLHGVTNLQLPNRWKFILKRPRAEKTKAAETSPSKSVSVEAQPSSAKKCLITKFTKVMTAEEKQMDWEKMKKSPPAKKPLMVKHTVTKITAFTSSVPPANPADSELKPSIQVPAQASAQPQVKKRVALLVSVPRGHDISSAVVKARSGSTSTNGSSSQTGISDSQQEKSKEVTKPEPEVIDLD